MFFNALNKSIKPLNLTDSLKFSGKYADKKSIKLRRLSMKKRKSAGFWTFKKLKLELTKKYNTRTKLYKGCGAAYNACLKNNWLNELFK